MTVDENTNPGGVSDAADQEPAATAPQRRRRAATRPAGAPAAVESGPVAETAVTADPEPPAPKTRRRTARAPRAAVPAGETVRGGDDVPVETPSTDPAPVEAAAKAPTRRRRAKITAGEVAAAEVAAADVVAADAAPRTGPDVPEPAPAEAAGDPPAAPRRRRRSARGATVGTGDSPPSAVEPSTAPAAPPDGQPADEAGTGPVATSEEPADQPGAGPFRTPEGQPEAEEQRSGRPPRLGTTMVLFQPPEPPAPRRRRAASRPAGPPRAAEEGEEPAAEERVEPVEQAGPGVDDEHAATGETDEDAGIDLEDSEESEESGAEARRRRRRRGGRGRRGRGRGESGDGEAPEDDDADPADDAGRDAADPDDDSGEAVEGDTAEDEGGSSSRRRRRRRRRGPAGGDADGAPDDPPNTVVRIREPRRASSGEDVAALRGSTRLEAKKQRRREGRDAGRRRPVITEAEFLARRESVDRVMMLREREGRTQIAVLEDGVLVEHYVARQSQTSMVGNVYLGKVQNVLPSMEAAFVDIGKGRNAVLYAGEVNWDAAGLEGQPKRIEHALKAGESVLVQVTKDPLGHKGARLTSQISLPGRYLVYVPDGSMTGISRKLPDTERNRLKKILRRIVPDDAGVIVRTAAEGASEEELQRDIARLRAQSEDIARKAGAVNPPSLLYGEPDLAIRVVRDIFNEDFGSLVISGDEAWETLHAYIAHVAPDLVDRLQRWSEDEDVFAAHRIDEQLAKGMERKVWLPSGGSLVIDRTEAMTVVDVNTGKFTGSGGNLEETVTKNNIEAAEEIVRQLRLRDIGGIIVVDFIDMVLESNRDLVMRRLLECLGRDRTKHQVAEVTSLGLVQMTRKRVGQGLLEAFSEACEHCGGRGMIVHDEPVEKRPAGADGSGRGGGGGGGGQSRGRRRSRSNGKGGDGDGGDGAPQLAEAAAGG